ncbi:MAG: hypothetical protein OEZ41_09135 [Nitrospirota bacterium]|nr:hypothetical protein [Nitrospirota bacterium]
MKFLENEPRGCAGKRLAFFAVSELDELAKAGQIATVNKFRSGSEIYNEG